MNFLPFVILPLVSLGYGGDAPIGFWKNIQISSLPAIDLKRMSLALNKKILHKITHETRLGMCVFSD